MFDLNCGVRLRAFRAETDLDSIQNLYNDTSVAPLISELFVIPRGQKLKDEFKELIEKSAEMFCIIETIPSSSESGPASVTLPRFMGITGLWGRLERGHRHVNYSIVLVPEFWGKGFGTAITEFMVDYAFHHLNMHRISLEVYEGNDRAAAVYRKQ
jgi:RimJ/RimL family protein N-acetyltransferase